MDKTVLSIYHSYLKTRGLDISEKLFYYIIAFFPAIVQQNLLSDSSNKISLDIENINLCLNTSEHNHLPRLSEKEIKILVNELDWLKVNEQEWRAKLLYCLRICIKNQFNEDLINEILMFFINPAGGMLNRQEHIMMQEFNKILGFELS